MADNARLLEIADEFYGLGLPEFTPARDQRAKEVKAEDKDLSARVKALRKPSTAAWVVDLLVRLETEQVEQVLAVGVALREAQASMSADELRTLTRQRRQLTAAVTTTARGLARDHGLKVTEAVADQVQATLTAAMVDEGCARAVRSGLLVAALATTGVDDIDPSGAVALPEALGFEATARDEVAERRAELHVVPDPDAHEKALAAAEELPRERDGRRRRSDRRPGTPPRARSRSSRRAACRSSRSSTSCAGGSQRWRPARRRWTTSSLTPRTSAPRPRTARRSAERERQAAEDARHRDPPGLSGRQRQDLRPSSSRG